MNSSNSSALFRSNFVYTGDYGNSPIVRNPARSSEYFSPTTIPFTSNSPTSNHIPFSGREYVVSSSFPTSSSWSTTSSYDIHDDDKFAINESPFYQLTITPRCSSKIFLKRLLFQPIENCFKLSVLNWGIGDFTRASFPTFPFLSAGFRRNRIEIIGNFYRINGISGFFAGFKYRLLSEMTKEYIRSEQKPPSKLVEFCHEIVILLIVYPLEVLAIESLFQLVDNRTPEMRTLTAALQLPWQQLFFRYYPGIGNALLTKTTYFWLPEIYKYCLNSLPKSEKQNWIEYLKDKMFRIIFTSGYYLLMFGISSQFYIRKLRVIQWKYCYGYQQTTVGTIRKNISVDWNPEIVLETDLSFGDKRYDLACFWNDFLKGDGVFKAAQWFFHRL